MAFETTTDEVVAGLDLDGFTAVVTGVSAGLGVETARALRSVGARVIGAVRSPGKAEGALAEAGVEGVELVELSLDDLSSARKAASEVLGLTDRIDALINNAGIMACPLGRTAQGFETQLGTNHLGHFAWTLGLLPALGAGSRVVSLSSRAHLMSPMRWDDPHFRDESTYDKWVAYGQSKTANVLFAVGLEKRLSGQGTHAFALHPGVIHTELGRHLSEEDAQQLSSRRNLNRKTVAQGAATQVWAAVAPELDGKGGLYLEDAAIASETPGDFSGGYAPYAMDPDEAERLWTWSEEQIA